MIMSYQKIHKKYKWIENIERSQKISYYNCYQINTEKSNENCSNNTFVCNSSFFCIICEVRKQY